MIAQAHIDSVIEFAEANGLSEDSVSQLRQQYDYHFTYCFEDDMDAAEPAAECQGFNIYFVNSTEHCSKLTSSAESASGLVLAEVIDD